MVPKIKMSFQEKVGIVSFGTWLEKNGGIISNVKITKSSIM